MVGFLFYLLVIGMVAGFLARLLVYRAMNHRGTRHLARH